MNALINSFMFIISCVAVLLLYWRGSCRVYFVDLFLSIVKCNDRLKFYAGRIPFEFLEDIHQRFVKTYGRAIHTASPYAMNEDFSRIMSQQMGHYSNDPNADRLNRLQGEMSHVCLIAYLCQMVFDHFEKFRLTHCWAWDGILSAGKDCHDRQHWQSVAEGWSVGAASWKNFHFARKYHSLSATDSAFQKSTVVERFQAQVSQTAK